MKFYNHDDLLKLLLEQAQPYAKRRGSLGVRAWAEAHDIETSRVSEWMTGKRRNPPVKMLSALGLEYRIVKKGL